MVHHLSTWFNSKSACVLQVLQSIHPELRTVVIQGFLINAVCRRARPAHLVSQTTKPQPAFPNASQPRGMAQLEVSTRLGSHSPGAQNCGNSRLPHQGRLPTRQISTSGVPSHHQHSHTHHNPVAWLSLKSVRVLGVTHLELRTVVIQGFLIKDFCRRARSAHLVSQTTKTQPAFPHASQPRGMAQLEVSTCLGSHSPGTQNCGNSRLPHQGRLPTRRISTSGVSNNQDTTSIPTRIATPWHGSA